MKIFARIREWFATLDTFVSYRGLEDSSSVTQSCIDTQNPQASQTATA
ncbi:hypothetical protein [Subtercola boreus]|nr:hypothetical protein [Subtercola boreus]